MRQMMEGVVLRGTGRGCANLSGYTSGGKTGTAQIYDFKAHAYTHHYNASFLGFAPVANPQIVIAVTMNDTTGGTRGIWRAGGGSGVSRGGDDGAADAGRSQGSCRTLAAHFSASAADENDLAIAGLVALAMDCGLLDGDSDRRANDSTASIAHAALHGLYPPSLRRRSRRLLPLRPGESWTPDRRPFLASAADGTEGAGFSRDDAARGAGGIGGDGDCRVEVLGAGWREVRIRRRERSPPGGRVPFSFRDKRITSSALQTAIG